MGSLMIEPTVIRGSSDEYGSWKMICIRRRSFAQLVLVDRGKVETVEADRSGGWFTQPDDCAPGGALAASRLAHETERLAAADLEADVVDRLDRADRALKHARPDREVDLEVVDVDQVRWLP